MRPLRLELRGFTSFRDTAVVDFEERRLFAITGPTGAGKSSLLDAMTWALYRRVPRIGQGAQGTHQLITHGAKVMAVRFDFSVRGARYRVSRQAPGNLGSRLERQRADGEWEALADRARDIDDRIVALIGLDFPTFTKTVLLPQGAFDAFLRGEARQRSDILAELLGLERYEAAGRSARSRAAGASEAARTLREQIERLEAATPEAIAALEREHDVLAAQVAALEARSGLLEALEREARTSAEAAAAAARAEAASAEAARVSEASRNALAGAEQDCERAQLEHDRLEAERAALGYDEQAHRDLEGQALLLEQREAATRAVGEAEAEQRAAFEAAEQASEQAAVLQTEADQAEAVRSAADEAQQAARDALAAAAAAALATEQALGEQANASDDERAAAESAALARTEEARRLTALSGRLGEQLGAVAVASREQEAARESHEAAEQSSNAADALLRGAEQARDERAAALEAAQRQDAALALQRGLKPGDPCPVCGEPIEHIKLHAAPELDEARAALEAAEAVLAESRGEHGAASTALAAADVRAAQATEALERAQATIAELREEAAQAGADPDALDEAVAAAETAAEAERARVAAAAADRDRASEAARALALLRASIGEAIGDEAPGEAGEPETVHAALAAAIEGQRAAGASAATAREAARQAGDRAREAASNVTRAQERRDRADAALQRAGEQLASLGGEDADPDAVRAALAAAKQQAARHRELETALREAGQTQAAADARREAACEALTRAEDAVARLAGALAEARTTANEAGARFAEAWTAAQVDGEPSAERVPVLLAAHRDAHAACARDQALAAQRLERARADAERAHGMQAEAEDYDGRARLSDSLAQELRRNRFIAYVQREAMQLLAADAAERLLALSSGRYRLVAEGDAFSVIDKLNGDERRSVKTLSGGETFLASLALALALSERLPEIAGHGGAMSLESLFLDEGFGSLDQDSLDIAIGGLESLAGGRRLVGVTSHVPEVAERLSDRIEVVRSGAVSTIRDSRASGAAEAREAVEQPV
ncbi:MAG: SMC family ATPase [Chloroflexi bacterium]|nr:SMC family ATPase [Chloroflexota bacterium]